MMKLTKSVVERAKYAKDSAKRQPDIRWDEELPGFGLRITPEGSKSFVLSYRASGRKHLMTLGKFGPLTVEQARSMARIRLAEVLQGTDPLVERRKLARGERMKDLCAAYLERYAKVHKKSWRKDESRINRYILPTWGNHRVSSITRSDVATLHHEIGTHAPYEANRVLEQLRRMFNLARRWGYLEERASNPACDIDRFKEVKRDRWVTPEELPRLAQAIDAVANPYVRYALWLYLLTGVRKTELLRAKWEDVDWACRELRLPETKSGRVHHVPLVAPAMEILNNLPRLENNPYILPGQKEGHHLVNIEKPWRKVRKAAGVEDVRLHDLRRTVGSWLAQAGNSLHLIGRVLNHSNQSTTAVYARFGQDHVREAMEAHAQRLLGAAGKRADAEVIPIRKTN